MTLTQDQRFLLAVNAGSNDLSVFRVDEFGLTLIDVEAARGVRPVSVTQHDDTVDIVNSGTSSITGFTLEHDSPLRFSWSSLARLSAQTTAPAQILLGLRGQHLDVSEKATNRITRFALDAAGLPTQSASMDSPGATPFGFDLGRRGQLNASEAAGSATDASTSSSCVQLPNGGLQVVTAALGAGQSATRAPSATTSSTPMGTSFRFPAATWDSRPARPASPPADARRGDHTSSAFNRAPRTGLAVIARRKSLSAMTRARTDRTRPG